MTPLPNDLTPDEMLAGVSEYGTVVPVAVGEEKTLRRTIAKGIIHLIILNLIALIRTGHLGRGKAEDVAAFYEKAYGANKSLQLVDGQSSSRPILFRLGRHRVVKMNTATYRRFTVKCLGDIVAACEPNSICEVGCGRGYNLFYLANRLPQVRCTGYDISENAIKSAIEMQAMTDLPLTDYGKSLCLSEANVDNVRKIDFRVGSAFSLPAADKSFDLVYTSAALEQMHSNIGQALSELRRTARRYVLMREPFAEGNDVLGRAFLWSQGYFRMRASELASHGLDPIRIWTEFPVKPKFAYSFVLCKVS